MSHDRNFLNAVVTDIIHLHSQRLESYRGDYENFIKTKEDRLKNQHREYEAQLQYREHIQVPEHVRFGFCAAPCGRDAARCSRTRISTEPFKGHGGEKHLGWEELFFYVLRSLAKPVKFGLYCYSSLCSQWSGSLSCISNLDSKK